jgi:prophage regulatory protein
MDLLTIKEVCSLVRVSRASIYRRMADANFPQPIRVGTRSRVWEKSTVVIWIKARSPEEN